MNPEKLPNGNFRIEPIRKIVFSDRAMVKAEGEMLPMCSMCQYSKLNCPNEYIRQINVPMVEGDSEDLEIIEYRRVMGNEFKRFHTGMKSVDGVAAGIITGIDDIPTPIYCDEFKPKNDFPDS